MFFSCDYTHRTELPSSQCSFLRISNNVSETSQNTLFSIGILCRPLRPTTQRHRLNFLILALYKSTYLRTYNMMQSSCAFSEVGS